MIKKHLIPTLLLAILSFPVLAQNDYQVTLLRAAPGELGDLLEHVKMGI